ncbi:MAG: hypothetical protein GF400_06905 [Candidatus Eisenbacteria bacterium]|nr:hypothetical protein [Candidatus Eisenbacteria bacterium]
MRLFLIALVLGIAALAWADTYEVPDSELGISEISEAMSLASAGDTVLVKPGVYDSVSFYDTYLGRRSAVVMMKDGVVLMGSDRRDVEIDQTGADYGILCMNVGADAVIRDLNIRGAIGRSAVPEEDGDGRSLVAGICCLDAASPTIVDVSIADVSSGLVVRSDTAPSTPSLEGVEIARCDHHGVYIYGNSAPVLIDHSTIVSNFDHGVYAYSGAATLSNCSITHNGKNGVRSYLSTISVEYCNAYWNDRAGGDSLDYFGLTDPTGDDGNVSVDPRYCDLEGTTRYNYRLYDTSPLVGLGEGGTDIGAWGIGCEDTPVEEKSWGSIKALFR